MFGVGWEEVLLIIIVVLLLFGAKRIPDVMRSLGKGIHEFKKGMQGLSLDDEKDKAAKTDKPEAATKSNDPK